MKNTGMVRGIDKMGRVVIPKEIRKQLNVENEIDSFEIFVDEDKVILKKYSPACIFCGKISENLEFGGHNVCKSCIEKMYEMRDSATD